MDNSIEWNTQNVPMRSYAPLSKYTRQEYDIFLQRFLRNWLRHNERFERQSDDEYITFTIYRDEVAIGKFEISYPFGGSYLAFGTHKMAHERAIEQYGREMKNWPIAVRDSANRMMFFYLESLRTLREWEDQVDSFKINPTSSMDEKNIQDKSLYEMKKTTVLFLAADPTDTSRLRLGQELREIQEKLQLGRMRDMFMLEQRMSLRPADISQSLLDVQPQLVHFSGHGSVAGTLYFENLTGEAQPVEPDALSALFENFANQVKCVVLNACYSENQANAIARHIDYVIGMGQAIGDRAAIAFSIGFYQALGGGRTIEDAYKLGCVQIKLQGIAEQLTPVLIVKNKKDVR